MADRATSPVACTGLNNSMQGGDLGGYYGFNPIVGGQENYLDSFFSLIFGGYRNRYPPPLPSPLLHHTPPLGRRCSFPCGSSPVPLLFSWLAWIWLAGTHLLMDGTLILCPPSRVTAMDATYSTASLGGASVSPCWNVWDASLPPSFLLVHPFLPSCHVDNGGNRGGRRPPCPPVLHRGLLPRHPCNLVRSIVPTAALLRGTLINGSGDNRGGFLARRTLAAQFWDHRRTGADRQGRGGDQLRWPPWKEGVGEPLAALPLRHKAKGEEEAGVHTAASPLSASPPCPPCPMTPKLTKELDTPPPVSFIDTSTFLRLCTPSTKKMLALKIKRITNNKLKLINKK